MLKSRFCRETRKALSFRVVVLAPAEDGGRSLRCFRQGFPRVFRAAGSYSYM